MISEHISDRLPCAPSGEDRQASAAVDCFYIHPTSFFSAAWNQPIDDRQSNLLSGLGMLTQQASAFNGVARIFAPRYRQVSQSAQGSDDLWNTDQNRDPKIDPLQRAMDLGFADVSAAFEYFLDHHNSNRPLVRFLWIFHWLCQCLPTFIHLVSVFILIGVESCRSSRATARVRSTQNGCWSTSRIVTLRY